jgi:hypothetical protein
LPIGIVFEGKGLDIFVKKFALLVSLLVPYAYGFLPFPYPVTFTFEKDSQDFSVSILSSTHGNSAIRTQKPLCAKQERIPHGSTLRFSALHFLNYDVRLPFPIRLQA